MFCVWQCCYGLFKLLCIDGGYCLYSDDDVQQVLKIFDWVKKGVLVSQVKFLLLCFGVWCINNWLMLQEIMLQWLKEGKIEFLCQLIYDVGCEYLCQELVIEVLCLLCSQVFVNVLVIMILCEIFDGIIIVYILFCFEGDKKVFGDNFLIIGWYLIDVCEIWFEVFKCIGQGYCIDVLLVFFVVLVLEIFFQCNWLLVISGKFFVVCQRQVEFWQQQVVFFEVILF